MIVHAAESQPSPHSSYITTSTWWPLPLQPASPPPLSPGTHVFSQYGPPIGTVHSAGAAPAAMPSPP